MLLGAERFIGMLETYRILHIDGRFGGGKTSLAVRIFVHFADKGYRLVTNTACVLADKLENLKPDEAGMLKAVCLLDEGGNYFGDREDAKELVSYAAKLDLIYILPSFEPPHRRLKVLTVQPVRNWFSIGLPLIEYNYRLKSGMAEDKGKFLWLFPQEVYGLYSRQDPGEDPDYIMKWLYEAKNTYRRHYGRSERKTFVPTISAFTTSDITSLVGLSGMEAQRRARNDMADMADEISEEIDTLTTILKGKAIKSRGLRR